MSALISELDQTVFYITFNRATQHNAFDAQLLTELDKALSRANQHPDVRTVVIKAHGPHFSAGADLAWMQRMSTCSWAENLDDARQFAHVLHALHAHPKPTIAMVHGCVFGGGIGIVAACDIAIAAESSQFCFSEVKLGLIPAVISPYIIRAIGERNTTRLFMTAEKFNAPRALALQLIAYCVTDDELAATTQRIAHQIGQNAPHAVMAAKRFVRQIHHQPLDNDLLEETASQIATIRCGDEAKHGIQAFLRKEKPTWS